MIAHVRCREWPWAAARLWGARPIRRSRPAGISLAFALRWPQQPALLQRLLAHQLRQIGIAAYGLSNVVRSDVARGPTARRIARALKHVCRHVLEHSRHVLGCACCDLVGCETADVIAHLRCREWLGRGSRALRRFVVRRGSSGGRVGLRWPREPELSRNCGGVGWCRDGMRRKPGKVDGCGLPSRGEGDEPVGRRADVAERRLALHQQAVPLQADATQRVPHPQVAVGAGSEHVREGDADQAQRGGVPLEGVDQPPAMRAKQLSARVVAASHEPAPTQLNAAHGTAVALDAQQAVRRKADILRGTTSSRAARRLGASRRAWWHAGWPRRRP